MCTKAVRKEAPAEREIGEGGIQVELIEGVWKKEKVRPKSYKRKKEEKGKEIKKETNEEINKIEEKRQGKRKSKENNKRKKKQNGGTKESINKK